MKDHFWFFVGGRAIPRETTSGTTAFTADNYVKETAEERWQVKLRGGIGSHVLEISHLNLNTEWENRTEVPGGELAAANGTRQDSVKLTTFTYQSTLTPRLFLDRSPM